MAQMILQYFSNIKQGVVLPATHWCAKQSPPPLFYILKNYCKNVIGVQNMLT